MKRPLASIVVATYNNSKSITKCINSILKQKFKNFELIIVDDRSEDNTLELIEKIKDRKIITIKSKKNLGTPSARNKGIKIAKGKYTFFIDGDCTANKTWIKNGLKTFEKEKCAGVEGKIYYISKNYKPVASDDFVENKSGNLFLGGNIAYKTEILKKINGFDKKLLRMQDRDLALKVKKFDNIVFCKNMIVYHQKCKVTFKKRKRVCREIAKTRVLLFKRYNDRSEIFFRIYRPLNLLATFFPPLIFGALFLHKYKTLSDIKTLLYIYPGIILERISLWKTCFKEKIFLI